MTVSLLRQAIRLYRSPYVSKEINRRNQKSWLLAHLRQLETGHVLRGAPVRWGVKQQERNS